VAARRCVSTDPDSPPRYLAVYEFDMDDIDASIESLYALAAEMPECVRRGFAAS